MFVLVVEKVTKWKKSPYFVDRSKINEWQFCRRDDDDDDDDRGVLLLL